MDPALTAAAIGVGGTVIVGVAGFWASVRNTNKTTALTLRALELTEQGQVTDRYSKAIEQLGSDKLDVRIGGIYELERIARDSARDHPTIMEVLAAFVREHCREQWPPAEEGAELPQRATRPDVQAAATVTGRRTTRHDSQPINLAGVDLTRVDLSGADVSGADLSGANLTRANLTRAKLVDAHLDSANLTSADLTRADLTRADLTHAWLLYANFTSAFLGGAILTRAVLNEAKLRHAVLNGTNLTDANLSDANLSDAKLNGTNLTGANLTDADFTLAKTISRTSPARTSPVPAG
jgi:uncharacterized protein YjbI with pentapeptide repeats